MSLRTIFSAFFAAVPKKNRRFCKKFESKLERAECRCRLEFLTKKILKDDNTYFHLALKTDNGPVVRRIERIVTSFSGDEIFQVLTSENDRRETILRCAITSDSHVMNILKLVSRCSPKQIFAIFSQEDEHGRNVFELLCEKESGNDVVWKRTVKILLRLNSEDFVRLWQHKFQGRTALQSFIDKQTKRNRSLD